MVGLTLPALPSQIPSHRGGGRFYNELGKVKFFSAQYYLIQGSKMQFFLKWVIGFIPISPSFNECTYDPNACIINN